MKHRRSGFTRTRKNFVLQNLRGRGFTLVELMVVIVILGILTSIGTFAFQSSQQKSRDSRRKSDLANVAAALEMYNNDRGGYPSASSGLIKGCGSAFNTECAWGSAFSNGSTVIYMIKLPKDPSSTKTKYAYEAVGTTGYRLYAHLENGEDVDIPTTGQKDYATNCSSTATTMYCNYVITSVNVVAPTPQP